MGASTDPAADDAAPRARTVRWVQLAVLALPVVVLAERAWSRRWMTDDGFINLRVARMILDGHGPVFNAGERVEPATSTLWVWLIAAGDVVLPMRMEWVSIVLGLVAAAGGLGLAIVGSARLYRSRGAGGVLLPLGAVVVAAVPPFWEFSTSGLEGGLTFGWIGLTGWLLCRWATSGGRFGGWAACAVGLAPLVRPDLALAIPLLLGGVLAAQWADDRPRDRLRVVAQCLAVPVAYQVFRMGYYGSVLPNTALAKSGGRGRWGDGWGYTRDFVQPYWLVVALLALGLAVALPFVGRAWRARDRRGLVALVALPVVGLVDALYVVRVGGDYMHGRLLLPALFALVTPFAAVPVTRLAGLWEGPSPGERDASADPSAGASADRSVGRSVDDRDGPAGAVAGEGGPSAGGGGRPVLPVVAVVASAVVLVWGVVAATGLRRSEGGAVGGLFVSEAYDGHVALHGQHAVTADDQGWGPEAARAVLGSGVEVHVPAPVASARPPGDDARPVYASWGIGVVGYALGEDVYVLDMLGLADPYVSRLELDRPGATGHEKPLPAAWLVARVSEGPVPEHLLTVPLLATPLYESPPGRLDADADAARRALACGELVDLSDAVHDRLTPGRFVDNLVGSLALTRLEIPPDPHEAEARFCG